MFRLTSAKPRIKKANLLIATILSVALSLGCIFLSRIVFEYRIINIYSRIGMSKRNHTWIESEGVCSCDIGLNEIETETVKNSICSKKSIARGFNQKVVSFSFYGNVSDPKYFTGIHKNAKLVNILYPGWVIRVFHDIDVKNTAGRNGLCQTICNYDNVDDCYVKDPNIFDPEIPSVFGMVWRFLNLGDPMVDTFMVRDLDGVVSQREVAAVQEWLKENATWHIMRDNPNHLTHILGGMWGVKNSRDFPLMLSLRRELIKRGSSNHKKTFDQKLLSEIVWPIAKNDSIAHDSYTCKIYPNTRPFPTRREGDFVGCPFHDPCNFKDLPCPEECRPRDHLNWTLC